VIIKTIVGNPYQFFQSGDVVCTTTNGIFKKDGSAIMGAGNAKFVRDNFSGIAALLGKYLKKYGNRCFYLGEYEFNNRRINLASFPTKHDWRDKSSIPLISKSTIELILMANKYNWKTIYVPMAGCSNGQLKWSQVEPILSTLDDRFIVYSLQEEDFKQ
jgi:hypothetical protein